MAKQPEFRKYLPLEEWFRNQPTTADQIELTFDQVEAILGTPLPKSATKLTTWWTNVQPKIQSHRTAWLNTGWKVAEFDQQARWVRFIRAWPSKEILLALTRAGLDWGARRNRGTAASSASGV